MPWLVDRCAVLLEPLNEGIDPKEVDVMLMKIVVRLHFIPPNLRSGKVVEQLGSALGVLVERVSGKRDDFQDYVRIRVRMDVTKPLKRGSFLRLGDGSRKWVAFTYELMPLYCYLCCIVGHMEKRCPSRYHKDFVDPRSNFSFGEWLNATSKGEVAGGIPLPLQPVSASSSRRPLQDRGEQVFGYEATDLINFTIGQENTPPGSNRGLIPLQSSASLDFANASEVRK